VDEIACRNVNGRTRRPLVDGRSLAWPQILSEHAHKPIGEHKLKGLFDQQCLERYLHSWRTEGDTHEFVVGNVQEISRVAKLHELED
jgi:hypothetical protein